ncbi:MAG: amino acid ABC transporter permease [Candidatus Coproplasma sp.]
MSNFEIFWNRFTSPGTLKNVLIGLQNTAIIAVLGLLLGFFIGCLLTTAKLLPSENVFVKALKKLANLYIAIFRGTPMMVQLLLLHFAVFIGVKIEPVIEVSLIFGLNSGAYMAEIIRGGINAVDKGQMEAGRSLGLSYSTTMLRIILPQAIKNILPSIGNEFISLLKETSIVSVIGLTDLTRAFKAIADSTFEYFIPYIALALIYFVLVMIISFIVRRLERRFAKNERK